MTRSRIVCDTNILVSSLWGGHPAKVVRLWQEGRVLGLLSQPILEEYVSVLIRFRPTEEDLDLLTTLISHPKITEWVTPTLRVHVIADDPSDNRFLECAQAGKADAIVSGDRHLLCLNTFHNIPILSAKTFLTRFERGSFPSR